ncbi:MAG: DUF4136 domain-containing protein [Cyclobacteriaceae bacterium]|nr:DUF4136 domain-containing protein [Cyclobacteriaceae bacterium]
MKRFQLQLLGILSLVIILSSCSIKVHSTYDKGVDFSKYKTFCWLNGCEFTYTGPTYLNDSLIREKIRESIVAEMNKKGLMQDDDNPDLLIDFHISMENESSIIYHHGGDNVYQFKSFPDQEVIHYLKGTIVIHMVDKVEGRMVWRSEAIGYMDINPDLSEKNIRKGIAIALKNYPPKKSKE